MMARVTQLACVAIALNALWEPASAMPLPGRRGRRSVITMNNLPDCPLRRQLLNARGEARTRALDMLNQIRDQSDLENDASYHVHPNGEITVVDLPATNVPNDPPTTRTRRQVLATPDSVDSNGVPIHHSRPSSNNKLFLNFQGEIVTGTVWNNPAQFDTETEGGGYDPITVRPFYASDNVPGPIQIAPENASRITDIWMKVAEDFRPFDVDVTTEVPSGCGPNCGLGGDCSGCPSNVQVSTLAGSHFDVSTATSIGGQSCGSGANPRCRLPAPTSGGVAFLNAWRPNTGMQAVLRPAFTFNGGAESNSLNTQYAATTVAHEAGHNFALSHDGIGNSEYLSPGLRASQDNSIVWGPIMGGAFFTEVTQWSNGDYTGSTNSQDDFAELAARLGMVPDEPAQASGGVAFPGFTADGSAAAVDGIVKTPGAAGAHTYTFNLAGPAISGVLNAQTTYSGFTTSSRQVTFVFSLTITGPNGVVCTAVAGVGATTPPTASCDLTGLVAGTYTVQIFGDSSAFTRSGTSDPLFSEYGNVGAYSMTLAATEDAGTDSPTQAPATSSPTASPTTSSPTSSPTAAPATSTPTQAPTQAPVTSSPSAAPTTSSPTSSPTGAPTTSTPTQAPTTTSPSATPTQTPTPEVPSPSVSPTTSSPTVSPSTSAPTASPTASPVAAPTASPTFSPTVSPTTSAPTTSPSTQPTTSPTTSGPTLSPTTSTPTQTPTTASPTQSPITPAPTASPVGTPTLSPTTSVPSAAPSTSAPAVAPTQCTIDLFEPVPEAECCTVLALFQTHNVQRCSVADCCEYCEADYNECGTDSRLNNCGGPGYDVYFKTCNQACPNRVAHPSCSDSPTISPTATPPSNSPTTSSPTTSPTTSSPTAATSAFFSVSGDCQVTDNGACFTDSNVDGHHGNHERCTVTVLQETRLRVVEFNTERFWDRLWVGSLSFHGNAWQASLLNGLAVTPSTPIRWISDGSVTRTGFKICNLAPAPFELVSGSSSVCQLWPSPDGTRNCITDGVGRHGPHERCTYRVNTAATLNVHQFSVASNDALTVGGVAYRGSSSPHGVAVGAGDLIQWRSNGWRHGHGYYICA
eukprot:m.431283 g.431283  ORF g.431283 m.431283 type:complete len:1086 (-) comp17280_c0_seq1:80-3337(-)